MNSERVMVDTWAWLALNDQDDADYESAVTANTELLDLGHVFVTTNFVVVHRLHDFCGHAKVGDYDCLHNGRAFFNDGLCATAVKEQPRVSLNSEFRNPASPRNRVSTFV